MSDVIPKRYVVATALYVTDNGRTVCGVHCGTSAAYTGRDISGQEILTVTDDYAREWLTLVGEPVKCEDCARTHDPSSVPQAAAAAYQHRVSEIRRTVPSRSLEFAARMTAASAEYEAAMVDAIGTAKAATLGAGLPRLTGRRSRKCAR